MMTVDISRTGETSTLFVQAGSYRLVSDLTLDDLERLATHLSQEAMTWRRDRNRVPPDYYQVLGLVRDASAEEIRAGYRRLARQYDSTFI